MSTEPIQPGGVPPSQAASPAGQTSGNKTRGAEALQGPAAPGGRQGRSEAQSDSISVSETAKQLAGQAARGVDDAADLELSPDRLKEIESRLAEGFYDRPEVREELAGRLLRELGG